MNFTPWAVNRKPGDANWVWVGEPEPGDAHMGSFHSLFFMLQIKEQDHIKCLWLVMMNVMKYIIWPLNYCTIQKQAFPSVFVLF